MPKTLYLLDGHALAYRAFFALMASGSRFRTRSGEPTAGTYGFANILLRIIEKEKPEYLAVAFDTGKTFRNKMYAEYKATRAKMPDELIPQIERIRELVDTFNIPRLEVEGYEADDVLGTVAEKAVKEGYDVKIITGDRDLLQLVNDRIIVNLSGAKLSDAKDYFPEDVEAYLGVSPNQVVNYKALVGDTSDNIPGVKGVGKKTATPLLKKYKNLDEIYAHLDEIPERVRKLLEAGKENAYLSFQLAEIHTDLDIKVDINKAHIDNVDPNRVIRLFQQLEFGSLISRIENLMGMVTPSGTENQASLFTNTAVKVNAIQQYMVKTHIVNTPEKLAIIREKLNKVKKISFDTETTSVDAMQADLVGISLSFQEGEGYYLPVGHQTGEEQLNVDQVVDALGSIFADKNIKKIGHNLKYDVIVLRNHGIETSPLSFDTMIAAWLVEPSTRRLGLKRLAETELGIYMTHIEDLIGSGKKQLSMAGISVKDVSNYAVADAEVPLRLEKILRKRLELNNGIRVFEELEMPLVPVLVDMEYTGISLDKHFFKAFSRELNQRMIKIEKEIYQSLGYPINIKSTQQLSKALFEKLGLQPPDRSKKTKSGFYSTSAAVLEEMRGQHDVVDWVLEYRELAKLVSTYLDALPKRINPRTGRVHTSFNQTGSVTGRLASSDPNLQNIPTRTALGHRVRQGFIARAGYVLLSVDYSQIELRIVACMSRDEAMLNAFRAGQDIHATTAAAVYSLPIKEITKEQRRHAKAINFGLIYGMSAFGLSRTTDLTLAEAEIFVKAYFKRFPAVKQYLDVIRKQAAKLGYVETLLGRRRYFPNLKNPVNQQTRAREEREAVNAPIQGTAADIIKLAMIKLPDILQQAGLEAKLLLQVHDELLLECPKLELEKTAKVVQDTMEKAYKLSIPLMTDAKWGINWGVLKPL
ncbi:MAG TPA: DNA polymerase I [Anaerolineae bacterium]|nr:DNA polymerase I [Anaerolineae bacterium]